MMILLRIAGILVFLMGLFFMAQGSGYLPWPAESFMVGATQWIYYGGGIAFVGLILIFASAY